MSLAFIPDDEGKIAQEPRGALFAPLLIGRKQEDGIVGAFQAKYGIKVQQWRGSSEDIRTRVLTEYQGGRYDADVADPTARQWFVNQGTFTLVGAALIDVVAEQAGASARFAVVSTDPGAFSQNSWIAAMKAQMQAKYPTMQMVDIRYGLGKPRSRSA